MTGTATDYLKTRRSLVARLKNWDDQESWQQFLKTYGRLIHSVAIQSGLTEQEAQDAVQETVISVAKTMPGFKYDPAVCSFKSWLRHLAQKRIADQFRKRPPPGAVVALPARVETSQTAPIERIADPASLDPDAVWEAAWKKHIFDLAIARVKTQAGAEQFQIFDFYVLRGWPVKKVAATLCVSAMQVYLAKHRVMRMIEREARRLEKNGT